MFCYWNHVLLPSIWWLIYAVGTNIDTQTHDMRLLRLDKNGCIISIFIGRWIPAKVFWLVGAWGGCCGSSPRPSVRSCGNSDDVQIFVSIRGPDGHAATQFHLVSRHQAKKRPWTYRYLHFFIWFVWNFLFTFCFSLLSSPAAVIIVFSDCYLYDYGHCILLWMDTHPTTVNDKRII